jgi:hypothetical protein
MPAWLFKNLFCAEDMMKRYFTTGEVAKVCAVAPRTVCKWFDSGMLRGFRLPGSPDRRIPFKSLVRFLKEHGIPLERLALCCTDKMDESEQSFVLNILFGQLPTPSA